jgi:hypothetical protein
MSAWMHKSRGFPEMAINSLTALSTSGGNWAVDADAALVVAAGYPAG